MGIYKKLRARLDQAGIRPSTRRGQNFLLDTNQLHFIVETGQVNRRDVVLEVGPGSGLLTRRLALTGCLLLAVELDYGLLPIAQEETSGLPNVFYMQGDILHGKHHINPEAMRRVEELLALKRQSLAETNDGEPLLKCVSNLPYSAGTPFVMNMCSSPLPWDSGVFLLQQEVAERMVAPPGDGSFGALSITVSLAAASATIERTVPPRSFWPRPKVDSAVVRLEFKPAAERLALPWPHIRAVTNAVFGSRRKILKNALKGLFPDKTAGVILDELGIDPEGRGERMSPDDFLAIAHRLPRSKPEKDSKCH